jgi:hypothetical protein
MDAELLNEYRRAYSQWEDQAGNAALVHPLARLGARMRDAMVAMDSAMTAGTGYPYPWPMSEADRNDGIMPPVTVAACHDDSDQCRYCAFPEYAPAILTIRDAAGDTHVCRDHLERGLAAATGATFDRGEVPDAPDPTTWLCIECGSLIPLGTETSPRHAARCSLHLADTKP